MSTQDTTLPPPDQFADASNMVPQIPGKHEVWATIPKEFNEWWDADRLTQANPFNEDSSAFWAWEGWQAAIAAQAQQLTPRCEGCGYLVTHREHLSCVRAMKQAQQAQGVPTGGWRVVPVEPTEAMLEAAFAFETQAGGIQGGDLSDAWAAMLAAAPQAEPPQAQGVPTDLQLRALWSAGAAKRHAWLNTEMPLMASSGKKFVTGWHESEYQVWLDGYRAAAPQAEPQTLAVAPVALTGEHIDCIKQALLDTAKEPFDIEEADRIVERILSAFKPPVQHTAAAPQAEPQAPEPAQPKLWRDGETKSLNPHKCQLCRVGVHSAYALGRGQPCDCPAGTCRMWNGGLRPAVQAPAASAEPQPEPTTWSRYVAGMIACYLKWPDDDERVEAVAGIIERRRWSDRQPEREPLSREQIEALPVWSPFVGLWPQSRQEIARAIEAAHGIGTKGGE